MFSNCSQKLLCHSREGGNDTVWLVLFFFLLLLPFNSYSEQVRTLSSMKLSECGQAVKDFKNFLREARHCQSDHDCVVMEGMCPLGCKFFVHKIDFYITSIIPVFLNYDKFRKTGTLFGYRLFNHQKPLFYFGSNLVIWRCVLNKVRMYFESNPDAD